MVLMFRQFCLVSSVTCIVKKINLWFSVNRDMSANNTAPRASDAAGAVTSSAAVDTVTSRTDAAPSVSRRSIDELDNELLALAAAGDECDVINVSDVDAADVPSDDQLLLDMQELLS